MHVKGSKTLLVVELRFITQCFWFITSTLSAGFLRILSYSDLLMFEASLASLPDIKYNNKNLAFYVKLEALSDKMKINIKCLLSGHVK